MKTKNTKRFSSFAKGTATLAGTLALTSALMSNTASADSCYIMVHGHGTQGNVQSGTNQPALDYWRDSYFDEYQGSDFLAYLLDSPTDNYAIVGYDSTDESGYPYWRNETAGEIARQMKSIKAGNGDGYTHDQAGTQCAASDDFYVVAHSQGAQQMIFMAGNATAGSPYFNTAFNADGSTTTVPYDEAFQDVLGIFTLGGAMGGTEGSDRVCNGSWLDSLVNMAFLGKDCNPSVEWLQTNDSYLARNMIGTNLAAPVYAMGGYKSFPGAQGASAGFLTGEDDGYINLASQMGCAGSPKRNLWDDLNQYKTFWGVAYGSPIFRCNNENKGTPRTYTMASIYTDHDSERNGGIASPNYVSVEDDMTCGDGQNIAGRIAACTQ
ncbi:hypothetical protein [Litoribacillus peritrichatus]|uniref:Uncharacterized protein n=1 Tax=Litoribacillus peritrichatus TaxID=718191 RepID=A0ABP7MBG9_9GAMM